MNRIAVLLGESPLRKNKIRSAFNSFIEPFPSFPPIFKEMNRFLEKEDMAPSEDLQIFFSIPHKFLPTCCDLFLPISLPLLCKIALDVAIGLNFLHSLTPPCVHLDLKLENVFLTKLFRDLVDGGKGGGTSVKIGDFGFSVSLDEGRMDWELLHRQMYAQEPWYLPPELIEFKVMEKKNREGCSRERSSALLTKFCLLTFKSPPKL